jgi:hypothetical protein
MTKLKTALAIIIFLLSIIIFNQLVNIALVSTQPEGFSSSKSDGGLLGGLFRLGFGGSVPREIKRIQMTRQEKQAFVIEAKTDEYIFNKAIPNNLMSGALIMTVANNGYRNMTLNWMVSLIRTNHTKFLVFCFDEELLLFLAERGYKENVVLTPPDWLEFEIDKQFGKGKFNRFQFIQLMYSRVSIWQKLAASSVTFLFSDPDVVFVNNYVLENVQFYYNNSYADILFMSGRAYRFVRYNTGFLYATPTKFVVDLFNEIAGKMINLETEDKLAVEEDLFDEKAVKKPKRYTDQQALNMIISSWNHPNRRVGVLDVFLYPTGAQYFFGKMNQRHDIRPLIVHASIKRNFTKYDLLKQHGLWYLDEEENEIFY